MNTSLIHLPESKQEQIKEILSVILNIVEAEKVILYGSYARGTFQEDNHSKNGTLYEYLSDFDILVILTEKKTPDYEIQDKIVNTINYKAPLNLFVHYMDQVNEGLERGQFFFTEILETGILLYDRKEVEFSQPQNITPEVRKSRAQDDFDFYYNNGSQFLFSAKALLEDSIKEGRKSNIVAHQLHQAVEAFYSAVLLVFTGYKPKIHNLEKYRKLIQGISITVANVFPHPTNDPIEIEMFSLLKRAYIGGKYKKDFTLELADSFKLVSRVELLKFKVFEICTAKINSF